MVDKFLSAHFIRQSAHIQINKIKSVCRGIFFVLTLFLLSTGIIWWSLDFIIQGD